ncbi:ribonuclease PH [candidate division WOR-1 bacterium RIFOXYB2_FULL_42_35]|uniref:Ribonuclease PH n=1 Tax=candidate division WOR-1 bacterium RIFOXYC2_FULL_41_25 TaxID=1802586 RepID=A0A1F4TKL2_UNCSA|nr:MAG: ribonuclease PH [candidate division WOR-1 bacterium RIFOXYA2_FULL_41_14]OGC22498.1 MAG: ribonuclease PH [candidate division WOR-1 bacterium RIFOXYB2_FULL_42_35]OGC33236.1 MAG: ribonuclease PH [candidate division WOR-1 bacterium RIFOXYC2_FULL_41_25]OGC42770.1 MAG: ribonuclease PH [candidate division WOR-1 bacterium RIFOXYD2_FULL_41_8]
MKRADGRSVKSLRPVIITRNFLKYPEGSVLIEMGNTKVICTASVVDKVPPFKKNSGSGWVTAEYAMLPRATNQRSNRDNAYGHAKGRTHEIQRLIGRSLRAVTDLNKLGERTIHIDCDVIQADGGTRTASITGAFVALKDAIAFLRKERKLNVDPISEYVAAISVGVVKGIPLLDLAYCEDVDADVDMNVVMTESGKFIEVQGTAEHEPFSKELLDQMLDLSKDGIAQLIKKQRGLFKK